VWLQINVEANGTIVGDARRFGRSSTKEATRMHTRRTLPLISALVLSSSLAFAQSDVPPVAPEAPVDQAPVPEAPPPAPMAPAPAPVIVSPPPPPAAPPTTLIATSQSGFKIE